MNIPLMNGGPCSPFISRDRPKRNLHSQYTQLLRCTGYATTISLAEFKDSQAAKVRVRQRDDKCHILTINDMISFHSHKSSFHILYPNKVIKSWNGIVNSATSTAPTQAKL